MLKPMRTCTMPSEYSPNVKSVVITQHNYYDETVNYCYPESSFRSEQFARKVGNVIDKTLGAYFIVKPKQIQP